MHPGAEVFLTLLFCQNRSWRDHKTFGSPDIPVVFAKYGHKTDPAKKILCTTKKREKWSFSVLNRVFEGMF